MFQELQYLDQRTKQQQHSILTTKVADELPAMIGKPHERVYVAFTTRASNWTTFTKIDNLE